jgi:hypothetical protein
MIMTYIIFSNNEGIRPSYLDDARNDHHRLLDDDM